METVNQHFHGSMLSLLICCDLLTNTLYPHRAPVAQLVGHRVVTQEVVSSTPTGPTLRVLK